MINIAGRLDAVLKAAGLAITGVSIGDLANKATWLVQPPGFQAAAQPHIDAFDVNDPAHDSATLTREVSGHLDIERLYSALVWVILDTYSAPATGAKYSAARTKIISAFKTQPWKV